MCGRFTLSAPPGVLAAEFGLDAMAAEAKAPRYNIAPSQPVAIVRVDPGSGPAPRRVLALVRWGLVPADARDAGGPPLINARAETAATRTAFRDSFRGRRCLVPADGFYEWQGTGRGKQPFYLRRKDGRPFAFAGLWDRWRTPDGALLDSCAILTTDPNEAVRPIHDRMPVILDREGYGLWLDSKVRDPKALQPLLRPFPADAMLVHPVSPRVNDVANDDPRLIEPAGQGLLKL